jgi:hypoxanthine phosphoribosyltransferase
MYSLSDFEPLITREKLDKRIRELGHEITADLEDGPEGLVVVGVLKGALVFMADLIRHLPPAITCDFLRLSSYEGGTESTGTVRFDFDLTQPIKDKHVLVVEDSVDTGLSMDFLLRALQVRAPRSIKLCTLLHKPARTKKKVKIDYLGFTVEDRFVIGYGLDYEGRYRNLDHIAALRPDVAAGRSRLKNDP